MLALVQVLNFNKGSGSVCSLEEVIRTVILLGWGEESQVCVVSQLYQRLLQVFENIHMQQNMHHVSNKLWLETITVKDG